MSLLDISPDFNVAKLIWSEPLRTGVLRPDDVRIIWETLNQPNLYIPDGIRFIGPNCFQQASTESIGIGRIGTVSIPPGCTVSPYAFNRSWVKNIICRGPITTDPIDSILAFLPSLEQATIRISNWPIEDNPSKYTQLPPIESCEYLKVLRLGGMPRFPDGIIRNCRNLETLFVDADVEEVSLRIFHGCINVKEIIPDNPKTTILWRYISSTRKLDIL